jgi:hypothetical protein
VLQLVRMNNLPHLPIIIAVIICPEKSILPVIASLCDVIRIMSGNYSCYMSHVDLLIASDISCQKITSMVFPEFSEFKLSPDFAKEKPFDL